MKHILIGAMFMDRTCCQRTRVAPKGPQNQNALYCIQGNLIILLAKNIGSSPIDIMHSIRRYDIVNCNGLSCFCELRLIDFREISSGLLRDIYFSFLTTVQPFISARNQIIGNIRSCDYVSLKSKAMHRLSPSFWFNWQ